MRSKSSAAGFRSAIAPHAWHGLTKRLGGCSVSNPERSNPASPESRDFIRRRFSALFHVSSDSPSGLSRVHRLQSLCARKFATEAEYAADVAPRPDRALAA